MSSRAPGDGAPGSPAAGAGTPPPTPESPSLERHQVRYGEPVSPSLARRPDGTPLRPDELSVSSGPSPRPSPRASPRPSPRDTPSPMSEVSSFSGAPRWTHRAEVYAPGAPGSASGDPQHKKSSQFDQHIHQMRDEQEMVQQKTFLNWINSHLRNHDPPMQITNLIEDLKDSTRLLALLNVLSGEELPVERGRVLRTPHFLSNANTALRFLQSKNIKLVNINPSDIVDGRPSVVLGLVWTIILHFQIEMSSRALEQLARSGSGSPESLEARSASPASSPATPVPAPRATAARERATPPPRQPGARKALMNWARDATKPYGIEVKDFGPSWRDGRAFVSVVHCIKPTAIDVSATERMQNRERLETAFKAAEDDLGIARLLDPEDVDVPAPDEKSVMTYVGQFLHQYPQPSGMQKATNGTQVSPEQEVTEITVWVIKTVRIVRNMKTPDKDSFEKFQSLRSEATEKRLRYDQLKKVATSVPEETWSRADEDWATLEKLLSEWQTYLDSRLPSPLKGVAEWVTKAETKLQQAADPPVTTKRASELVTVILEEHTVLIECST